MKARPVYLNLFRIHLPLPGLISFAHRISGLVLLLLIPLALYALERSLSSPEGFYKVREQMASPWFFPLVLLLVWSLCHHLLAGIRFLLMDIDVGLRRRYSQQSAAWVGGAALVFAVMLLVEFYL